MGLLNLSKHDCVVFLRVFLKGTTWYIATYAVSPTPNIALNFDLLLLLCHQIDIFYVAAMVSLVLNCHFSLVFQFC